MFFLIFLFVKLIFSGCQTIKVKWIKHTTNEDKIFRKLEKRKARVKGGLCSVPAGHKYRDRYGSKIQF